MCWNTALTQLFYDKLIGLCLSSILRFSVHVDNAFDKQLMYSSACEIGLDATICYSLVMECCHFLIVERVVCLIYCRPVWCQVSVFVPCVCRVIIESLLCQAYLAFNSSTQLIKRWVETKAGLIYHDFVLQNMGLLSRSILTALMQDMLWLLM